MSLLLSVVCVRNTLFNNAMNAMIENGAHL